MIEAMSGEEEDLDIWMRAVDGDTIEEEWKDFFTRKEFVTGVDFPLCLFYKELMAAFPEAKVVLSTRDPRTWHGSVYNSIWRFDQLLAGWSFNLLMKMVDGRRHSGRVFFNKIHDKVKYSMKGCFQWPDCCFN